MEKEILSGEEQNFKFISYKTHAKSFQNSKSTGQVSDIVKTLSNSHNEAFCENSYRLKAVKYFY